MGDNFGEIELRLVQICSRGEKTQCNCRCTELARGYSVKAKLDRFTADQFFEQACFAHLERCPRCHYHRLVVAGFEIDNPNLRSAEFGIISRRTRQHQIDPTSETQLLGIL